MDTAQYQPFINRRLPAWAALAGLVPLLLLALSGIAEGFPNPALPGWVMISMCVLAVALMPFLLWKGWMWGGLLIYSAVSAFAVQVALDEMASSYKTPFTFLAALIAVAPALVFQFSTWRYRWIFLVAGLLLSILAIGWLSGQYWGMVDRLGYTSCYPGCLPLSGRDPSWWQMLLGLSG